MRLLLFLAMLFIGTRVNAACTGTDAEIWFGSAARIETSYDPDLYCWDIAFLERAGRGPMPVTDLNSLYPAGLNASLLRRLGFTPDLVSDLLADDDGDVFEALRDNPEAFIAVTAASLMADADYTIDDNGRISNDRGRACVMGWDAEAGVGDMFTLRDVLNAMPIAARPVAMQGMRLVAPMPSAAVATMVYDQMDTIGGKDATKSATRNIMFSHFPSAMTTPVSWDMRACPTGKLALILEKNSRCALCRHLVFFTNEISYIFNYMFLTFRYILISFIILAGCFAIAGRYWGAFKGFPFTEGFGGFLKGLGEKMRVIVIAGIVAMMPPKTLFSFTLEPVLDLTVGLSQKILSLQNDTPPCNSQTVVDELRGAEEIRRSEKIIPPVVRLKDITNDGYMAIMTDGAVLSPETVGAVVCFMRSVYALNAKGQLMGQIFFMHPFRAMARGFTGGIVAIIMGVLIWGFFWWINLMIGFYILDAFYGLLKIAITWPFRVFGYAFDWTGFSLSDVMTAGKDIGITLVSLSVFAVYNTLFIASFQFAGGVGGGIDEAIRTDNADLVLDMIQPGNILELSKFLFVLFVMWYFYSNMNNLVGAFGGKVGDRPLGNAIKRLFASGVGVMTTAVRGKTPEIYKKAEAPKEPTAPKKGREEKE